jgi:beta-glucosidase
LAIPLNHASADNETKVRELIAKMTLDEKIGQMVQPDSAALLHNEADITKYRFGSVLSGGNSNPTPDNSAESWLGFVSNFQSKALQTRLKIPLLFGIDAVHGHNNVTGAVIFPHNIGLGASRNPELVEKAARVTAEETAATGIRWAFSPCVAVAGNIHWGRTYESFGDSTDIAASLGAAAVRGIQGAALSGESSSVLACAKHFIGDGGTQGGVDQGDTVCDEATLRKLYLPPYAAAIKAGVGSIMVSFSSWNGVKMHANKHLLTEVLKGEMGFQGFLISDWAAIDQISSDYKHDVEISVNAGLDMIMIPYAPGTANNYVEFITDLKELIAEGKVPQSRIDDAVSRILLVKFRMGLFEPISGPAVPINSIGSPAHRQIARECVRQSLVLLKNEKHALPLSRKLAKIHVVGAAADDLGMQCGGWTIDWQGATGEVTTGGTTLLKAIRQAAPSAEVTFSADAGGAKGADAVIVVIGEAPYAEMKGDSSDLKLTPADLALVEKARESGAHVITVLLSGRPRVLDSALDHSDAFVAAWLPGSEGQGVADVLFGDQPFKGKLPRHWPRNNGQLSSSALGVDGPLFPIGYGLTY